MQKPVYSIATAVMLCVVVLTLDIFSLTSPAPGDTKKLLRIASGVQQRGVGGITKERKWRGPLPLKKRKFYKKHNIFLELMSNDYKF